MSFISWLPSTYLFQTYSLIFYYSVNRFFCIFFSQPNGCLFYFYQNIIVPLLGQNKLSTFIHSQNLYIDIISLFILHHEMTNYADLLFNSFRHGIVCFSNIPLFPASLSHTILSRHILPVPITIETVD